MKILTVCMFDEILGSIFSFFSATVRNYIYNQEKTCLKV